MKKLLVAILFCACIGTSLAKVNPSFEMEISLKKDEILKASIISAKNLNADSSEPKSLTMRWTLYRNEGLVVLLRYDNYPYQFMLYKDYRLNSWTLNLLDTQGVQRDLNQPQIKIYFLGIDNPFNDEKSLVHFRIYGYGDVSFMQGG